MDLCFVFVVEPASGLVASFHAYVVAGNQSSEDGPRVCILARFSVSGFCTERQIGWEAKGDFYCLMTCAYWWGL